MAATDDQSRRIIDSQNGDHDAFESLIREHQHMIHSVCYRMTGSLTDAEDLAQETFILGYRHLGNFRQEASFSSWLYRIAINQCLNWNKSKVRRERFLRDWSERNEGTPNPESARSEAIQQALLKLNPNQRAAVVLTTFDGLTHAEAAHALGCSETTVSWRLFMARAKLRRLLKGLK